MKSRVGSHGEAAKRGRCRAFGRAGDGWTRDLQRRLQIGVGTGP